MFKVRPLTDEDYSILNDWWDAWGFPAPPKEYLPMEGKGGIMVTKDDVNICAGFIFFTNSKMVWIEFIVSNKEYRGKDRAEAIRLVINELTDLARRKGFKACFTSLEHKNLITHYEACGYTKSKNATTEMIIRL